jgi:hypothetical protein
VIEIGSMRLEFHEKATASMLPEPVDIAPRPAVQIPTISSVCPFCGGLKDASGACECSVGAQPAGASSTRQQSPPAPSPAVTAVEGPRLVAMSGPYAGQAFPLVGSGATSIGREPGRSIELPMDTTVSRRHARIENEGGTFFVYDEGSSNGTVVNGVQVSRQPLAPGDAVQFGSSAFRFEQ